MLEVPDLEALQNQDDNQRLSSAPVNNPVNE